MDSTLVHINDLPIPISIPIHQRGLISSFYDYSRAVFLIPKRAIPDSINKKFPYSEYGFLKQKLPGFRVPLHGAILDNFSFKFLQHSVNMGLVQLVKSRVRKRR